MPSLAELPLVAQQLLLDSLDFESRARLSRCRRPNETALTMLRLHAGHLTEYYRYLEALRLLVTRWAR